MLALIFEDQQKMEILAWLHFPQTQKCRLLVKKILIFEQLVLLSCQLNYNLHSYFNFSSMLVDTKHLS